MKSLVLAVMMSLALCAPLSACGRERRDDPIRVEVQSTEIEREVDELDNKNRLGTPTPTGGDKNDPDIKRNNPTPSPSALPPNVTKEPWPTDPRIPYNRFYRFRRRFPAPKPLSAIRFPAPTLLTAMASADYNEVAVEAYLTSDGVCDTFQ